MSEIKKSIAFDIQLAPPAKIPKSIAEKLQISKKENIDKEILLGKLDLAYQRKKSVVESKTLKARNVVIHAKEIVYKMRELDAIKSSQSLARIEYKLNHANLKKEKVVETRMKKLEDHNVNVVKDQYVQLNQERIYSTLLSKLAAAEDRRRKREMNRLAKLKDHAEHARLVREKKVVETA